MSKVRLTGSHEYLSCPMLDNDDYQYWKKDQCVISLSAFSPRSLSDDDATHLFFSIAISIQIDANNSLWHLINEQKTTTHSSEKQRL